MKSIMALTCLLFVTQAQADITVGPPSDPSCDFHLLQDAIYSVPAGGAALIRLTSSASYPIPGSVLLFDRDISIIGGYQSCTDSTPSNSNPAVIESIQNNRSVINILSFDASIATQVFLRNVIVRGGDTDEGGGLKITGNAAVTLYNASAEDNAASQLGGGIYFDGSDGASLLLKQDSTIEGNSAQSGGGIYCIDGTVTLEAGVIEDNDAVNLGGGLALDNCTLIGRGGSSARKIEGNQAGLAGGGIHVDSGTLDLGDAQSTTLVSDNTVTDSAGRGGGIYANSSTVGLLNTHIEHNHAHSGGGMRLDNSSLLMNRSDSACALLPGSVGCASIANNESAGYYTLSGATCMHRGGYGAGLMLHQSSATLNGVFVVDNLASRLNCTFNQVVREAQGSAISAGGSSLVMADTQMTGNGGNHAISIIDNYDSDIRIVHSTLANNRTSVNATVLARGDSPQTGLWGTIVHETADLYDNEATVAPALSGYCNVVSSAAQLTNGAIGSTTIDNLIEANPGFVNAGAGNFALQNTSAAVDVCTPFEIEDSGQIPLIVRDLANVDRPSILVDADNPMDAGAFENPNGSVAFQTDLAIQIFDLADVQLGEDISYSVQVQNNGPWASTDAFFVVYLDPAIGTEQVDVEPVVPANWDCTAQFDYVVCRPEITFFPGTSLGSVIITASGTDQIMTVETTAEVRLESSGLDPIPSNNYDLVQTMVGNVSNDLAVDLSVPEYSALGDRVLIDIDMSNHGFYNAYGVELEVLVPNELLLPVAHTVPDDTWTCDRLAGPSGYRKVVCSGYRLNTLNTERLVLAATAATQASDGLELDLRATLGALSEDPDLNNNVDSEQITLLDDIVLSTSFD